MRKAKGGKQVSGGRRGVKHCLLPAVYCLLLTAYCLLPACSPSRARLEAEAQARREAARARFGACLPERKPEGGVRLAISAISLEGETTEVRLAAYTVGEEADFDLPQYLMSRGRWLINERARSYLLDEACREYRLKDLRLTVGDVPRGGRVKLGAGESLEFALEFPRLPDDVHSGALVYGGWVLPFYLLPAAPPPR
jgi:hypothetical protein